jgi:hypothetical protein
MQIHVNTDRNIQGSAERTEYVRGEVEGALRRFGDWITRVEVHLSDENSSSKNAADDIRCVLEARPAGQQPVSVSHQAATVDQAVKGSARKLVRLLNEAKDRLSIRKGDVSFAGEGLVSDDDGGDQVPDEAVNG